MNAQALRRIGVCLSALTLLAGCGLPKPGFNSKDITGTDCCRGFRLTDQNGRTRTLADFRGKVVVMFFGYTQCPDVCPTTMAELSSVMRQLGTDARRVQVLFVTLDPERDTRTFLAQYVSAFDPGFLGLYGDIETTARTAKEFRVFYRKQPGRTPGSYTLEHTAGSYVFDPRGQIRLLVRDNIDVPSLVADLRTLLRQE